MHTDALASRAVSSDQLAWLAGAPDSSFFSRDKRPYLSPVTNVMFMFCALLGLSSCYCTSHLNFSRDRNALRILTRRSIASRLRRHLRSVSRRDHPTRSPNNRRQMRRLRQIRLPDFISSLALDAMPTKIGNRIPSFIIFSSRNKRGM